MYFSGSNRGVKTIDINVPFLDACMSKTYNFLATLNGKFSVREGEKCCMQEYFSSIQPKRDPYRVCDSFILIGP